ERALALLVELDAVLDRLRLAPERAGLAQQLDDRLSRAPDRLATEDRVPAVRGVRIGALPARRPECDLDEPAVAADDLTERELLLAPPLHVGRVAEGADHENAGALLRV